MNFWRKIAIAGGISLGILGTIIAGPAVASRINDTVFKETQYREFFKQEGNGDKNYLYTRTEQPAPPPGKCYVYTFASETGGAVVCSPKAQG